MKTRNKIVALVLSAALLVGGSVMGTLAYLTSQETVTNTFSVGNVKITLDELDVDNDKNTDDNKTYGEGDGATVRDKANAYKLIPGQTYVKDPTIHVAADSEECWLFVKVVDEIADIQDATTVADQMKAKGWTVVEGQTGVYAYKEKVSAGADVVVFENFKIKGDVTNTALADYADKTIKVEAYAVQAAGFNTAADAWAKAPATWTK